MSTRSVLFGCSNATGQAVSTFLVLFSFSRESHRYVLKNKDTDEVFFVVIFALIPREDASDSSEADSDIKAEAKANTGKDPQRKETENLNVKDKHEEEKKVTAQILQKDPKKLKGTAEEAIEFETSLSDLD